MGPLQIALPMQVKARADVQSIEAAMAATVAEWQRGYAHPRASGEDAGFETGLKPDMAPATRITTSPRTGKLSVGQESAPPALTPEPESNRPLPPRKRLHGRMFAVNERDTGSRRASCCAQE